MITFLPADEVARLIADGESSFVEFKNPALTNSSLAKELCAFANASGGYVFIGVDDDGSVVGANGWDDERAMNLARTSVDPPLIPSYQRVTVDEKVVVVLGVETGTEKPHAVTSGESRRYYIRVGTTSREASREELIRLTQSSGAVVSDLRPVHSSSRRDLDDAKIAEYLDTLRTSLLDMDEADRLTVFRNAEILSLSDEATVYGLLCFGSTPEKRMPHAVVLCAAYPTADVGQELVDREEIGGTVDSQIERTVEFARRNLRSGSTIEDLKRNDRPVPSDSMLREAIANAVSHRHYGINAPTKVDVFSDRLVVTSPGSLPNGVTSESIRLGITVRRNQFIVQFLARRGYVDALGRGVLLLLEEARTLGLPEPALEAEEGWVRLVIPL